MTQRWTGGTPQNWWDPTPTTAVPRGSVPPGGLATGGLPAPGSAGPGTFAPPPGYIYNPATGQYELAPGATVAPGYAVDPGNPLGVHSTDPTGGSLSPGQSAVTPAPAQTTPPATGGGGGPQVTGPSPGSAPTAFDWPTFTAPTFNAPAPYSYPSFEAPSLQDAQNAPGYQFGLQQGLGAMTNSRAAQGVFRTGATPKAFFDYANSAAEQNYGNVFNQRLSAYQTNATNAANTYNTNYTTAKDTYNSAFQNAAAEFNPAFQAKQLTFQDMYNRWRDGLAATTAVATAGAH